MIVTPCVGCGCVLGRGTKSNAHLEITNVTSTSGGGHAPDPGETDHLCFACSVIIYDAIRGIPKGAQPPLVLIEKRNQR
jgi:hypothetical protein